MQTVLRELLDSILAWGRLVPRSVRWTIAAGLAVVVALGLLRAAGGAGDSAKAPRLTATHSVAMLRVVGSAVIGTVHDPDGAAAAAISYAAQRNALLTGGTTSAVAAEVGGTIAMSGRDIGRDPASIPERAGAANTEAMLQTRAGQLSWWTIPFGYEIEVYSDRRAVVRVFFGLLSVGALPADGPGAISLTLQDVDLRWVGGAWRLWRVSEPADQPAAIGTVAVSTRRQMLGRPFPQRVIKGGEQTGVPLFTFLDGAAPVLLGPDGMGAIAGADHLDAVATAVVSTLHGLTRAAISRYGMRDGGHGGVWLSTVPVAYRPVACPSGTSGRCLVFLLVGAGTQGGPALVTFNVGGMVVQGAPGRLSARLIDVPAGVERAVLDGQVRVASNGSNPSRAAGLAWSRSIRPLIPTEPAVGP